MERNVHVNAVLLTTRHGRGSSTVNARPSRGRGSGMHFTAVDACSGSPPPSMTAPASSSWASAPPVPPAACRPVCSATSPASTAACGCGFPDPSSNDSSAADSVPSALRGRTPPTSSSLASSLSPSSPASPSDAEEPSGVGGRGGAMATRRRLDGRWLVRTCCWASKLVSSALSSMDDSSTAMGEPRPASTSSPPAVESRPAMSTTSDSCPFVHESRAFQVKVVAQTA